MTSELLLELVKDKDRLDWLNERTGHFGISKSPGNPWFIDFGLDSDMAGMHVSGKSLRQAVDLAMEKP